MKTSVRGAVPPFLVMEMMTAAAALAKDGGERIIHMSLGQPGQGLTAKAAADVAARLASQALGYTETEGLPELREKIAALYKKRHGLHVSADEVIVTVGSSMAFQMAALAAFDAGDKVAMVEPCYPAYRNILLAFGVKPVDLAGNTENNFQPSLAALEALDEKIDGLIIASPSNPSGTIIDAAEIEKIVHWCRRNNVRIISDEIYHGVTYGKEVRSFRELAPEAVVLNSFSKYFRMSGWRLGWLLAPEDLRRSIVSLGQSMYISAPAAAQYAALSVMDCEDELQATVATYAANRQKFIDGLAAAGITRICPAEGAFYVYADVSDLYGDSMLFCREMLANARVCAVPGHDFDSRDGHRYVRFSYCGTEADINEAVSRIQKWLRTR